MNEVSILSLKFQPAQTTCFFPQTCPMFPSLSEAAFTVLQEASQHTQQSRSKISCNARQIQWKRKMPCHSLCGDPTSKTIKNFKQVTAEHESKHRVLLSTRSPVAADLADPEVWGNHLSLSMWLGWDWCHRCYPRGRWSWSGQRDHHVTLVTTGLGMGMRLKYNQWEPYLCILLQRKGTICWCY